MLIIVSEHFFRPDRLTSQHPLVIVAGFDGTGLHVVARAFQVLGRSVAFPAIDLRQCKQGKSSAKTCSTLLYQLNVHGLQAGYRNNTPAYEAAGTTTERSMHVDSDTDFKLYYMP